MSKYYYVPINSLNFNNILSSETISPSAHQIIVVLGNSPQTSSHVPVENQNHDLQHVSVSISWSTKKLSFGVAQNWLCMEGLSEDFP